MLGHYTTPPYSGMNYTIFSWLRQLSVFTCSYLEMSRPSNVEHSMKHMMAVWDSLCCEARALQSAKPAARRVSEPSARNGDSPVPVASDGDAASYAGQSVCLDLPTSGEIWLDQPAFPASSGAGRPGRPAPQPPSPAARPPPSPRTRAPARPGRRPRRPARIWASVGCTAASRGAPPPAHRRPTAPGRPQQYTPRGARRAAVGARPPAQPSPRPAPPARSGSSATRRRPGISRAAGRPGTACRRRPPLGLGAACRSSPGRSGRPHRPAEWRAPGRTASR